MSDSIKSRLIKLAAQIARGEYHPSGCIEDYRKGMGRREFAEMAGEYADRARGQVRVLTDARDEIDRLEMALSDQMDARSFLLSLGYTRCDIPTCNCGSFHKIGGDDGEAD